MKAANNTRRLLLLSLAILFLSLFPKTAGAAGSGGDILWSTNYSRPGLQEAISSTLDPQGNIVITGFTDENQGDYLTVKIDTGTRQVAWAEVFDKSGNSDQPTAVTVDAGGDVIVTGYVFTQTGYDVHTIKYCGATHLPECASGGDVLWQHTWAAPYGGDDFATAITSDIAGNVYVAGFTQGANGDDFLLIKYAPSGPDASGNPLWIKTLDSAFHSHDRATSVAVRAGLVAVVGDSHNGNDFDIMLATWNADGTQGKGMRYDGGEGNDFSRRVKIDANGNVIFAGTRLLNSNTDFYFASFNPVSGVENWHNSYDNGSGDDLRDLLLDSGGDVYVTGTAFSGSTDTYVGRYAGSNGQLLWGATPYSSGTDDTDIPASMVIDESGDLFISGFRQKGLNGDDDFMVLKYNRQSGQLLWDGFFNGPANRDDQAIGIGLDAGGRLFVAGWSDRTLPLGGAGRTASSGTTTTVTVNSAGWAADHWLNCEVIFTSGALNGYSRRITGNSSDTLTFTPALPQAATAGMTFRVAADTATGGSSDTAAAPSTSTLIDSNQAWSSNQWNGYRLYLVNGANAGTFRDVTGNTATAITVSPAFSSPPSAGDLYYLMPATDYDYFALEMDPGLINPPDSLVAATVSESEIKLDWNQNSDNEEGFEIFRKTSELAPWPTTAIATTGVDVTTFNDSGLTADTRYFYRVRAYNSTLAITSHYSNTASALTTVVNYPAPAMKYIFNSTFNDDDYATAIAAGPDNNPVVTGYSYEDIGQYFDYYTIKIDRLTGLELWHGRYDDPDGEGDIARCVAVNQANETFVSGYASLAGANGNTNDICTLKYSASGPPAFGDPHEWQAQYNGPGGSDDRSVAVGTATDASGNVYVAGYGRNSSGDDDIYLLKYASDGTRLWPGGTPETPAPYDGGGNDYPSAMAVDTDGNVIIVGESFVSGNDYDIFVRKYSGVDGSAVWIRTIDYANGWDVGNDIAVDTDNDVYIVGEVTNAGGDTDGYLMKLSAANGQNAWTAPVILAGAANGGDAFSEIKIDVNDNQLVVAGTTLSAVGNNDFITKRYTSSGQPVWSRLLDRPAADDLMQAMAMDASGNVCVAGISGSGNAADVIAVKYTYNGDILGSTAFDRGQADDISGAAAAASGEIWLAGYSINSGGNADYLVMVCNGDDLMAPSPFTATANYIHVDLSWHENATDADGYNLRKQPGNCATADPGAWIALAQQTFGTTAFTDNNLAPNDTFCYQIQSYRGSTTSRWIELNATTTDPPAPAGFTAAAMNTTRVKLDWTDNIVNEEGFRLSRCDNGVCAQDSDFTVTFPDLPPGTTRFFDHSACEGKTYTYRLIGFSSQWAAYAYAYATVTTPAAQAPTILSATPVNEGRIDLAWSDANSDEDAFLIYSCIDSGSGCTPDTANPTLIETPEGSVVDLKMNESTWTPGTADARDSSGRGHNATVQGTSTPGHFDGNDDYLDLGPIAELVGAGNFSAEIRFKRDADHQETMTSHGTHNVLVAQSSSTETDHLEIGTSGGDIEVFIRDLGIGEHFFTIPAGIVDNQWYHLVLTYDANAGNELNLYLDGALIWQTAQCDGSLAVSGITPWAIGIARPDGTANNLWGDFEGDIDQITLYNRTLSSTEVNRFSGGGNLPLSTTIEPLIPNTTYRFWLTAKKINPATCGGFWATDSVLGSSAASVTATTPDVGAGSGQEPLLNSATVSPADPTTNVNLNWTDRSGTEEKFIVERCDGDCSGGFTADPGFNVSLPADTTTYSDNSACEGTYSYRIIAGRDNAPVWNSGPSNILTTTTATAAAPSGLVDPPTMVNESEVKLSWNDNSDDEFAFDIQRCTGASCSFVDYATDATITIEAPAHSGTGAVTFIDTTAVPDRVYRYRVRAKKDTGCTWTTAWTNTVGIDTAISQIGTLSLSAAAANTTSIDLAWNDITSHEGNYILERCDQADCSSWQTDVGISLAPDTIFHTDSSAAVCAASGHSYRVKAVSTGLSLANGGCFAKRMPVSAISPFIPGAITAITIAYDPAMRSDFADLRLYQFTDATEVAGNEIPYWLSKKTASTNATIWFIAPVSLDNLYLYYGNPAATSSSDGSRIFPFFDDFAGKGINTGKWAENDSLYADKISQNNSLALRFAGRNEWSDVIAKTSFDRGQNDLTLYFQATYLNPAAGYMQAGWFIDNLTSKSATDMAHCIENSGSYIYLIREQSSYSYARDANNQYSYFTYGVPYEFKIIARKNGGAQYFIRGGEGSTHYYPDWHLIFDSSGSFTPLNTTTPLRPAFMAYNQDTDIHNVAAFSGETNEAAITLGSAENTGCAMPQNWEVVSNTVAVTTTAVSSPQINSAAAASESEVDINWSNNVADYSGTVVQRCRHTVTVDCTSNADFADRADLTGIIDSAGAAPLVKLRFEESSWPQGSASVTDSSGNNINATPHGNVIPEPLGQINRGAGFNGRDSYIEIPGTGTMENVTDSSFTFAAWAKPLNLPPATDTVNHSDDMYSIIIRPGYHSGISYNSAGRFVIETFNSSNTWTGITSPQTYAPGVWHHVAGVVDDNAKTVSLYVDGVMVAQTEYTGALRDYGTQPYRVGAANLSSQPFSRYFNGTIDEAAIFAKALSAEEVAAAMGARGYYHDQGLALGTTYTYRIHNYKNSACPWQTTTSAPVDATTPQPPPPNGFNANVVDSTTIALDWQNQAGGTVGYNIEKSVSPDNGVNWNSYQALTNPEKDTLTYTDTELAAAASYKYRIRAFGGLANDGGGTWQAKQPLTINNFLPDMQVRMTVTYDSLMNSDFSDIRFYDENTGLELPHWIESKTDGVSATVWFRTGTTDNISLIFNNPYATTDDAPAKVFELYDDFSAAAIDTSVWDAYGATTSSGQAVITAPDNGGWRYLRSKKSFSGEMIVETTMSTSGDKGGNGSQFTGMIKAGQGLPAAGSTAMDGTIAHIGFGEGWCAQWYTCFEQGNGSSRSGGSIGIGSNSSDPFSLSFTRKNGSSDFSATNLSSSFSFNRNGYTAVVPPLTTEMNIFLGADDVKADYGPVTLNVDRILVRKYAATPPTAAQGTTGTTSMSAWQSAWTDAVPTPVTTPQPPEPVLTAATTASESGIDLSWSWSFTWNDQSGFDIERCQGTSGNCLTYRAAADVLGYADHNLDSGGTYCYRVRALKEGVSYPWTTSWSNQLCATTNSINAPTGLGASPDPDNTNRMNLGWQDNFEGEDGYMIFRCPGDQTVCLQDSDFSQITPTAGANQISYDDTGVCSGNTYSYKIKAFNDGAALSLSNSGGNVWSLRTKLSISGFVADNQTRVIVPWRTGMKTDFSDVRFYDEAAGAELPYWIESKTDGVSAVFWFKSGGNNQINIYFDNPDATYSGDPNQVFIEFAAGLKSGSLNAVDLQNTEGFIVEANVSAINKSYGPQININITGNGQEKTAVFQANRLYRRDYNSSGSMINNISGTFYYYPENSYHNWQVRVNGQTLSYLFDRQSYISGSTNNPILPTTTPLPHSHGTVSFGSYYHANYCTYRNIFVRRFVAVEPVVSLGASESGNSPAWESGFSAAATATSGSPVAPTLTDPIIVNDETSVSLNWSDTNPDESDFIISRADWTGSGCGAFTDLAPTSGPDIFTYTNTGLTPNNTYCYKVRARKNAAGSCPGWDGPESNMVTVTASVADPDNLTATAVDTTRIDLGWNNHTTSETGFTVKRCDGGISTCTDPTQSNFNQSFTLAAAVAAFSDPGVCPATTHTYAVQANGGGWDSAFSNIAAATTNSPTTPANLILAEFYSQNNDTRRIDLGWTDTNSDKTRTLIQRCDLDTSGDCSAGSGNFQTISAVAALDTFDSLIDPLIWSSWYQFGTTTAAQTAPPLDVSDSSGYARSYWDNGRAVLESSAVNLGETTWNQNRLVLNHPESLGSGDFDLSFDYNLPLATGTETATSLQVPIRLQINLGGDSAVISHDINTTGHKYWWRITTNGVKHDGSLATTDTAGGFRVTRTGATISIYIKQADGSWGTPVATQSDGKSGTTPLWVLLLQYTRRDQATINKAEIDNFSLVTPTAMGFHDQDGILPSHTYYYRVKSEKSSTACAVWDNLYSNTVSELTNPAMPVLSATAPGSRQIDLHWTDAASDEDGYSLEKLLLNGKYIEIKNAAPGVTDYTDTRGIDPGGSYTYRVRSFRDDGGIMSYSAYSTLTLTTPTTGDNTTCVINP